MEFIKIRRVLATATKHGKWRGWMLGELHVTAERISYLKNNQFTKEIISTWGSALTVRQRNWLLFRTFVVRDSGISGRTPGETVLRVRVGPWRGTKLAASIFSPNGPAAKTTTPQRSMPSETQ